MLGDLTPTAFLTNPAGAKAKQIADANTVYVFPTRTGNQTAVSNNRQADMVDLSGGYFPTIRSASGCTSSSAAIIESKSDIDSLAKDGYVALIKRGTTETGRYFVCPVYQDPTNGAISPDAFLATVRRSDGTALPAEQGFVTNFQSLQTTGRSA